jgi:TATA-box binding protein (TBP) (component of TFIID and TFIIIB)
MFTKLLKILVIGGVVFILAGGLFFGKDLISYAYSSAKSVRTAVKNSVPVEFELTRARDLLDRIIPEMHANIRLIAQEEVEIAALKADIERNSDNLAEEKQKIAKLRNALDVEQASYSFGDHKYTRADLKLDLSARFERFKEAELVFESKKRLMASREKSLQAAMQVLEQTRSQKTLLADKICALESQHRLIQAASVGSKINIDNSKLAKTEKLIAQIKKRLDIAERVLAHESLFVQTVPVDIVTEKELIAQVDEYFAPAEEKHNEDMDSQIAAMVKSER